MRAAAQLAGERSVPHLDHPHHIAVLLAEQRHRPESAGLLESRGQRVHGLVLEDPTVDLVLDLT